MVGQRKDQARYVVVATEDECGMKSDEEERDTIPQWVNNSWKCKGQYRGSTHIHSHRWRIPASVALLFLGMAVGGMLLLVINHRSASSLDLPNKLLKDRSRSHTNITLGENPIPHLLVGLPWNPSMTGLDFSINDAAQTKPDPRGLGKKLVVLDVDTRAWATEDPAHMSQLTWGRLNHYLYAQMHGYDYKFVQAPPVANDTHPTWVKVQAIREVLKEGYKFVVFTDSDVIFPHLRMSMEYLLQRWNVSAEIAVTIGHAPKLQSSLDRVHQKQGVNTGFMMVQDTPITDNMLKDWAECPSEVKYPGCAHWKNVMWHEQSAYNDYIRYDYPNVTREVPCNEVNGAPEHEEKGEAHCDGILVRHYWVAKNKVKEAVQASIADAVLPEVVDDMMMAWTA